MIARLVAVVVVLGLVGCRAHVVLDPPPPPTSAEVTRRDYFASHRSLPVERGQLEKHTRMFQSRPAFIQTSLVLPSGVVVREPADLAPLVHESSDSAQAIAESRELAGQSDAITGVGLGLAGVGVAAAVGIVGYFILVPDSDPAALTRAAPPEIFAAGGCALVAVAGAGVVAWGMSIHDDVVEANGRAFKGFDKGLWQKLALPGEMPPAID